MAKTYDELRFEGDNWRDAEPWAWRISDISGQMLSQGYGIPRKYVQQHVADVLFSQPRMPGTELDHVRVSVWPVVQPRR